MLFLFLSPYMSMSAVTLWHSNAIVHLSRQLLQWWMPSVVARCQWAAVVVRPTFQVLHPDHSAARLLGRGSSTLSLASISTSPLSTSPPPRLTPMTGSVPGTCWTATRPASEGATWHCALKVDSVSATSISLSVTWLNLSLPVTRHHQYCHQRSNPPPFSFVLKVSISTHLR